MSEKTFRYIENRYYRLLEQQRAITLSLAEVEDPLEDPASQKLFAQLHKIDGKLELAEELLALEKNE